MHRNKQMFSPILAVIPGKQEPKRMDAHWQPFYEISSAVDHMEVSAG